MSLKWLFLFGLMFFGQFSHIEYAQAQNVRGMNSAYAKSYREFVDEKQLKGLSDLASNQVYCGNTNTICNTDTQVCLKCSRHNRIYMGYGTGQRQEGFCAAHSGNKVIGTKEAWDLAKGGSGCFADAWEARNRSGLLKFVIWALSPLKKVEYTISAAPNGFIEEEYKNAFFGLIKLSNNEKDRKFCTPDETECYLLYSDSDSSTLAYGGDKKDENGKNISHGCEVLPIKIYNLSKCFFCPLSAAVFDAANDVTALSFAELGSAFRKLLVVVFALWLAVSSLRIVFTYTKQDGNKHLSSILVQGGKFLFAYFLLINSQDLFNYFVSPILKTGISMALHIGATDVSPINYVPSSLNNDMYFNAGNLYGEIERFLAGVQAQLSVMQGIGTSLFCVGFHQVTMITGLEDLLIIDNIAIAIPIIILGAILFVFAILLTVSFGFYFLDAIIQMAILGAMMPLMIAGWPFKLTANYANTGKEMLLNVFFTIFFIGFVVSVEVNLVDKALEEINRANIYDTTGVADDRSGGLSGLFNAINNQNGDEIRELAKLGFSGFLILLFACFFGFQFVSKVPELANKLAEGANTGVAVKAGTTMASAAKGVANVATKPFREMAKEKWAERGGALGAVGRVLKAPGKAAALLGRSKLVQAAGRSKLGRGLQGVKNTVRSKAGSLVNSSGNWVSNNIGGLFKKFGAKMTLGGRNAIRRGRARKGLGGFFQRVGGRLQRRAGLFVTGAGNRTMSLGGNINKAGNAMENGGIFGRKGVAQRLGDKLEARGKEIAKRRLAAEKDAGLRSRFEADYMRKYGKMPTAKELDAFVKTSKQSNNKNIVKIQKKLRTNMQNNRGYVDEDLLNRQTEIAARSGASASRTAEATNEALGNATVAEFLANTTATEKERLRQKFIKQFGREPSESALRKYAEQQAGRKLDETLTEVEKNLSKENRVKNFMKDILK